MSIGRHERITPTAKSGFASCGVPVVKSSSVFQLGFCTGLSVWHSENRLNAKSETVTNNLKKIA